MNYNNYLFVDDPFTIYKLLLSGCRCVCVYACASWRRWLTITKWLKLCYGGSLCVFVPSLPYGMVHNTSAALTAQGTLYCNADIHSLNANAMMLMNNCTTHRTIDILDTEPNGPVHTEHWKTKAKQLDSDSANGWCERKEKNEMMEFMDKSAKLEVTSWPLPSQ